MALIRNLLSYSLLLSLLSTALCKERCDEHTDNDAFQKLLAQVDPPSLHAALHDFSPKKFSHGMFPEDRTALEAIHKEEPGVATGILKMAKIGKRQDNGTVATTTVVPPNPTTTVEGPVPVGPETSSVVIQTEAPATSPNSAPSSEAAGAPDTTSAEAAGTTSPPDSSASSPAPTSSGAVFTTTDSQGRVIVSTIGGGATTIPASQASSSQGGSRSLVTSYLLQTSTLPNGEQSTLTAVTVIGGGEGETATATEGASRTSGGQPGLQTGEATMTRGCGREMAVVLGAAVGMAFML